MTLVELGAQFREARVHRGLLVDDVAKTLKIPAKALRAIEDGNRDDLPELVFLRGFIKSYGVFLGFPQTELQKAFDHLQGSVPAISGAAYTIQEGYAFNEPKQKSKLPVIVLILAIVALIGGGIYYMINNTQILRKAANENQQQDIVEVETQEEVVQELPPQDSIAEISEIDEASSQIVFESVTDLNEQAEPEDILINLTILPDTELSEGVVFESEEPLIINPNILEEEETVPLSEEAEPALDDNTQSYNIVAEYGTGDEEIIIRGIGDCWTRIRVNNASINNSFTLTENEDIRVNYSSNAEILFGNAGGVEVVHNDENLGSPGAEGEVVTLTFP